MALLKCCECNKDVSEYADKCPNCGCPINKIKESIMLHDKNKLTCKINEKIFDITWIKDKLISLDSDKFEYYKFYCSPEMDGIKNTSKHVNDKYFLDSGNFLREVYNYLDLTPNPARKFLYQLIDSNFTLESFDGETLTSFIEKDISRQTSKPHCPQCGSTAITAGQRGYSILTGFIGSNKIVCRCANCGHSWKPGK